MPEINDWKWRYYSDSSAAQTPPENAPESKHFDTPASEGAEGTAHSRS